MTVATSFDRATLLSQKLVIPVRYAAGGEILQTTSTSISPEAIHVRAERPPRPGLLVGFKLYFDEGEEIARGGWVSWITAGRNSGFWARFNEEDAERDRVGALLARHPAPSGQGCKRFHTNMAVTVRKERRVSKGQITNISQSGAFLKVAPFWFPARSCPTRSRPSSSTRHRTAVWAFSSSGRATSSASTSTTIWDWSGDRGRHGARSRVQIGLNFRPLQHVPDLQDWR